MKKKTYQIISIIFSIISVIGLVSFACGVRAVNIGAFVFPAIISAGALLLYKKKE